MPDEAIERLEALVAVRRNEMQSAERALRDAYFQVSQAARKCYWCDKTDEDNLDDGYGELVDFTVVCANGEEGYSHIERLACQEHLVWLQQQFNELGFHVHAHGGICFLETIDCPGYRGSEDECPTPEPQYAD